jgi:hypothetical protein
VQAARRGCSFDPHSQAVVQLAQTTVEGRGHVPTAEIEAARAAVLSSALVLKVLTNVARTC